MIEDLYVVAVVQVRVVRYLSHVQVCSNMYFRVELMGESSCPMGVVEAFLATVFLRVQVRYDGFVNVIHRIRIRDPFVVLSTGSGTIRVRFGALVRGVTRINQLVTYASAK